jgi:hypothetical protein
MGTNGINGNGTKPTIIKQIDEKDPDNFDFINGYKEQN